MRMDQLFLWVLRCLPLLVPFCCAAPAWAAGLNDTGVTTCYGSPVVNYVGGRYKIVQDAPTLSLNDASDTTGSHPRQDCRYGRDAKAAPSKGFAFTKIVSGEDTCIKDNITGLTWETKRPNGPRSLTDTFVWYNSVPASNGGYAGDASAASAKCSFGGACTTEAYVNYVNSIKLCGEDANHQWRLPTKKELVSIVDFGRYFPAIDTAAFVDLNIPVPVCQLTATPDGGTYHLLTASCNPAAYTYIWTDPDCLDRNLNPQLDRSSTCRVRTSAEVPSAVKRYYVLGVNEAGASGVEAWVAVDIPLGGPPYTSTFSYQTVAPNPFFWSATPMGQYPSAAFGVRFTDGRAMNFTKSYSGFVRLVRGPE